MNINILKAVQIYTTKKDFIVYTIKDNTIMGRSKTSGSGVETVGAKNNSFYNNTLWNFNNGIKLTTSSDNNTINNNTIAMILIFFPNI